MAIVITQTGADKTFVLNSKTWHRNFMALEFEGDMVSIVNVYDTSFELLPPTIFSDFTVNGNTYLDAESLVTALSTLLFYKQATNEQDVQGKAIEQDLSGAEVIDLNTHITAFFNLLENTTITVSNPPPAESSFVRTWTVKSDELTETLSLPGTWIIIGSYNPAVVNYLRIEFINFAVEGEQVLCYINQDD